jgi:hypothetical protein
MVLRMRNIPFIEVATAWAVKIKTIYNKLVTGKFVI